MADQYLRYIDTHIHLDQYDPAWVERLLAVSHEEAGVVTQLVAVSTDLRSSERTEVLAKRYPGRIWPAYGYHPEQPLLEAAALDQLLAWMDVRQQSMAAIGEVGLPFYMRAEAEARGETFAREAYVDQLVPFMERAARWDKPIVLHAVYDDAAVVCDWLERCNVKRAHFHWFKGDRRTVERMAANGYYISFTPDLVYEQEIQELVGVYPVTQVMTETDGPWPFEGPFTGRMTEPQMVQEVVAAWAKLQRMKHSEAAQLLWDNAQRLYLNPSQTK